MWAAITFDCWFCRYQYPKFNTAGNSRTTKTFSLGDPISPSSIEGIDGTPARLFLPFAVSSRLILIIGIQSSSGPSPPPRPSGQDSAPLTPLLGLPPAA